MAKFRSDKTKQRHSLDHANERMNLPEQRGNLKTNITLALFRFEVPPALCGMGMIFLVVLAEFAAASMAEPE